MRINLPWAGGRYGEAEQMLIPQTSQQVTMNKIKQTKSDTAFSMKSCHKKWCKWNSSNLCGNNNTSFAEEVWEVPQCYKDPNVNPILHPSKLHHNTHLSSNQSKVEGWHDLWQGCTELESLEQPLEDVLGLADPQTEPPEKRMRNQLNFARLRKEITKVSK